MGLPKAVAPSALAFRPNGNLPVPNELTKDEIKRVVKDFVLLLEELLKSVALMQLRFMVLMVI